ncbi:zinc finger protein 431-like [Cydia fagiglandana]|uniref:zinc finger protein 431-like n=1 Tax=Cydia fagiglandana TaxID=1458189 RepID=UPI002FEDF064
METNRLCCCCLLRPPDRGMTKPYSRLGDTEIYSDMLADCFNLHVILDNNERGICLMCIDRLIDASDFKKQVQRSQAELQECIDSLLDVKDEEAEIKLESTEDNDIIEAGGLILYEPPKWESPDNISDYNSLFLNTVEDAMVPSQPEPYVPSEEMVGTTHSASFDHFSHDDASQACQETLAGQSHPKSRRKPYKREKKTVGVRKEKETSKAQRSEKENDTIYPLRSKVKFESKPKLNNDYTNIFATGPYTCQICKMVITTRRSMACHMLNHTEPKSEICDENTWDCDVCEKKFTSKLSMTSHMINLHRKKIFKCDSCSKKFPTVSRLEKHKVIHTKRERNYGCEVCGKRFVSKYYVDSHVQFHTGYKPYTCDICQKQFFGKNNMREHIRAHMGVKPYTCNKCGKKFTCRSSYKRHDLFQHSKHMKERAFSCDICNKSFVHSYHLKQHKRLHTGEKPYACNICSKQFAAKYNLSTHSLTHVKGTYSCELCPKSYATKEGLRQHKRVHISKKDIQIKRKNK